MSCFISTKCLSENKFPFIIEVDMQIVSYRAINYTKVDSDCYFQDQHSSLVQVSY
jgi:hypothetical protein